MEVKVVNLDDLGKPIIENQQIQVDDSVELNQDELDNNDSELNQQEDVDDTSIEPQEVEETQNVEIQENTIEESSVLNFLKDKYNKDIDSIESLFQQEESEEVNLPEGIQKLLEYQKNTGRSIEDYVSLNKDWDNVSDDSLIRNFLRYKKPHLDENEIDFEIRRRFSYDEEVDEESDIYAKRIDKKDFIYEAKNFFNDMKESYSAPLESSVSSEIPNEYKEAFNFVNEYNANLKTQEESANARKDNFLRQTNDLLNSEFEGFKFKIDENKEQVFKPSDVSKIKQEQSDINNFFNKFLDGDGNVKDVASYHKALSVAMNPDKFAQFFYEQGKSDAIEDVDKESKNLDMNVRATHEERTTSSGMKIRTISGDSESELKLKIRR